MIMGNGGVSCFNIGHDITDNLHECKLALPYIISVFPNISNFVSTETAILYPKGCYIYQYTSARPSVWFNSHEIGAYTHADSAQLCTLSKYGQLIWY